MDGKHVKIVPPPNSGSTFYNYKRDYSIVLLDIVDAHLKFLYIDVGMNGRISDGVVWSTSNMKFASDQNKLHIHEPCNLPNSNMTLPHILVTDNWFGSVCTVIFCTRGLIRPRPTV